MAKMHSIFSKVLFTESKISHQTKIKEYTKIEKHIISKYVDLIFIGQNISINR